LGGVGWPGRGTGYCIGIKSGWSRYYFVRKRDTYFPIISNSRLTFVPGVTELILVCSKV